MRKTKRFISLLSSLIMALSIMAGVNLSAYAATSGDYTYSVLDDGTVEITDYNGSKANLTIPSIINGYSVTSIGYRAFYDCDSLTSVTIPSSITNIGNSVFEDCVSLTSVTIPSSVTSIGNSAFCYCESLTSVTIQNGVTSIGAYAFADCDSLASITIPVSVASIPNWAFDGCSNLADITVLNKNCEVGICPIPSHTTIYGYTDSTVQTYATENGNKFVALDGYFLTTPQNVTASNLSTTGAKLTWNSVSGATGYEIQYLLNGAWKTMCEVGGNTKTFSQLTSNRLYVMRVRAFQTVNGVKTYSNNWSAPVAFTTYTTSNRMEFSNLSTTGATAKIKAVTDAGGYEIQYLLNGQWKTMCEVASTTKVFSQLTANRFYTMRVRAVKTVNGTKVYSANWSSPYSFTTYATASRMSFSNINSKGATLNINKVQNAGGYALQYVSNGVWKDFGDITTNSRTFSSLASRTEYTFRIRAYSVVNGQKVYSSNWSGAYSFTTSAK